MQIQMQTSAYSYSFYVNGFLRFCR